MGSPHVRGWSWASVGCSVLCCNDGYCNSHWCEDLQLVAHNVGWQGLVHHRNEVRHRTCHVVHCWWFVGCYTLRCTIRHAADRHLLHRCPLPLRVVWWNGVRLVLRFLLLVAKSVRQDAERKTGFMELLADGYWYEPHIWPHAHSWFAGPATPYVCMDRSSRR